MCGFVSVLQSDPIIGIELPRRALDSIAHRGPDASGEWTDGSVFLGHRRLSIIDLATGDQPMESVDGRLVIVFNGEIYNFAQLRELLVDDGATFRTRSDTEVILEGYRRWGADVVHRLHGMFAFVIWDRLERVAFGARDRLGIKPLCWTVHRGALLIASTLDALQKLGVGELDMVAIRDLMAFDYIPAPRTIYRDVRKLEPGSCLLWRPSSREPTIHRYWTPPLEDRSAHEPDQYELEDLLDSAVERQMVSDVPLGAFLSGGIDSSLLVAMMVRHSDRPVRTFSVRFSEGSVDESPIAELVARRFGTDHTVLNAEDLGPDALLDLIARLDEPFCDPTLIPTYTLSQMTRRHVKVALAGDGGDEVFGGYPKYLVGRSGHKPSLPFASVLRGSLEALPWRPRGAGRALWHTLSSQYRIRYAWTRYGTFPVFRKDIRQLVVPAYSSVMSVDDYFEPWERQARCYGEVFDTDVLMRADLRTYLSENCLVKTDRASMLASLEVRVPFLDETILDRVLPIPGDRKIAAGRLKALLVPIAQRLLPMEVWNRPKHGFTVPLHVRLAGAWRPAVETVLHWGESHFPLFDYGYLRRLCSIGAAGEVGRELWNPFMMVAWARAHDVQLPDLGRKTAAERSAASTQLAPPDRRSVLVES